MSEQYVYFIQADEAGPIKIGFTSDDPSKRLAQLQTANASALKLLGAMKGSPTEEKRLHTELAEWRMQGEWFKPHPTVIETIERAIASGAPRDNVSCVHCSFCFVCQDNCTVMVQGPAGNICDACIRECVEILEERETTTPAQTEVA